MLCLWSHSTMISTHIWPKPNLCMNFSHNHGVHCQLQHPLVKFLNIGSLFYMYYVKMLCFWFHGSYLTFKGDNKSYLSLTPYRISHMAYTTSVIVWILNNSRKANMYVVHVLCEYWSYLLNITKSSYIIKYEFRCNKGNVPHHQRNWRQKSHSFCYN